MKYTYVVFILNTNYNNTLISKVIIAGATIFIFHIQNTYNHTKSQLNLTNNLQQNTI